MTNLKKTLLNLCKKKVNKGIIRTYIDSDKSVLLDLFEEFGQFLVDIDDMSRSIKAPGYAAHVVQRTLEDVKNKNGVIYVYEMDEGIVGFIAGTIGDSSQDPDLKYYCVPTIYGVITELYIKPGHRGESIGSKLMAKMEQYFLDNKCDVSHVEVFGPNNKAQDFYKNKGYHTRSLDMIKKLRNNF